MQLGVGQRLATLPGLTPPVPDLRVMSRAPIFHPTNTTYEIFVHARVTVHYESSTNFPPYL